MGQSQSVAKSVVILRVRAPGAPPSRITHKRNAEPVIEAQKPRRTNGVHEPGHDPGKGRRSPRLEQLELRGRRLASDRRRHKPNPDSALACVLMFSIGHTAQASIEPAMQPARRATIGLDDFLTPSSLTARGDRGRKALNRISTHKMHTGRVALFQDPRLAKRASYPIKGSYRFLHGERSSSESPPTARSPHPPILFIEP